MISKDQGQGHTNKIYMYKKVQFLLLKNKYRFFIVVSPLRHLLENVCVALILFFIYLFVLICIFQILDQHRWWPERRCLWDPQSTVNWFPGCHRASDTRGQYHAVDSAKNCSIQNSPTWWESGPLVILTLQCSSEEAPQPTTSLQSTSSRGTRPSPTGFRLSLQRTKLQLLSEQLLSTSNCERRNGEQKKRPWSWDDRF